MTVYKFRLQKLLDYKASIEEKKKNELGIAIKRLEKEKHRLAEQKQSLNEMNVTFKKETAKGLAVNKLKILLNYIDYYKRGIKQQKIRVKLAEDYLSICREELIKATQEKKMMEKLKEIDFNKYLYDEQKKDEKLIDDLICFKESNNA
ncbi:MAG TPA: flagellar export protein FliJ [Bacillota bacterium]|nr:flagellar export protein FliJ [Bacillota bacterium]